MSSGLQKQGSYVQTRAVFGVGLLFFPWLWVTFVLRQSEITPIVFHWPLFACCRQGPEAAEDVIPLISNYSASSFSEAWIRFLKFVVQFYGRLNLHNLFIVEILCP